MDVWESNSLASAFTAHSCDVASQDRCIGEDCGTDANPYSGLCDPDGCDFNSYRVGASEFYGNSGKTTIDSRRKITVVTQFHKSGESLSNIRRVYLQDGKVVFNPNVTIPGLDSSFDSIAEGYCTNQKTVFGDTDAFAKHGGLKKVGQSLDAGMVLSISLLTDPSRFLWLDSQYPPERNVSLPGVMRGPCPVNGSGTLPYDPDRRWSALFSNIRFGDIGSTFNSST